MATVEGRLTVDDGTELYTKTWVPEGTPKAIVAFVHGFSDHCNNYSVYFPALASRGIEVHAFDQRGWGRSVKTKSDRGNTGSTEVVLADITSFINSIPPSSTPFFLMGHSMGGAEVLYYATVPEESAPPARSRIRGYIAQAPLISLHPSTQPSSFTIFAGRLAGKLLPKRQMVQKMDSKLLCRDPKVCKDWDEDELNHDTGTLEGLAGMLDRAAQLDKFEKPAIFGKGVGLFLGHGSKDMVTSFDASKRFMDKVQVPGDKQFRVYDGWYHNLHAEPGEDKIKFANDVADWILARCEEIGDKPKL